MATATYTPQSSEDSTNFTSSTLAHIQDDPDSPDANWWTANTNTATSCRVGFGTAPVALTTGAGLQEFKVYVRKNNTRDCTCEIELWENGSLVRAGGTNTVNNATGQTFTFTWNGNEITDPDQVECRINGHASTSGAGSSRSSVEVGAIEWNATIEIPDVKTWFKLTLANIKTWNGLAKANVGTTKGKNVTV